MPKSRGRELKTKQRSEAQKVRRVSNAYHTVNQFRAYRYLGLISVLSPGKEALKTYLKVPLCDLHAFPPHPHQGRGTKTGSPPPRAMPLIKEADERR